MLPHIVIGLWQMLARREKLDLSFFMHALTLMNNMGMPNALSI
jgi:hypothetical protein